ncbi:MAG: DUF5060 domain-containing protein [Spirosomataceae bacterium]
MIKKLVVLLLLSSPLLVLGQKKVAFEAKNSTVAAEQYRPIDLVFKVSKLPDDNPFDLTFGALFTDESNKKINISGFYNGNNEYILRFSPEKAGTYHYLTFSALNALSGLKGIVKAEKNTNEDIHGGLTTAPENSQKMVYQDGKPYFALAFELDWLFALDIANKNALPKTEEIIRAVKENGFNQVVMNVYAYDVGWKVPDNVPTQYSYKKPPYTVFKGTNAAPDFSQLNTDFFQHLDRVIQHLHEKGIVAHLMIYVWNKKVNWPAMYSADDNRYFDYVIKRYQAYPNVLWDVSKEALDYGRCDIPYINERIERIRRNDVYRHLLTVHDYEYCAREPDKVDIISIQNWRSDLYSLSLEAYQKHPDKPVMNIEHGGYEEAPYPSFVGNYVNPETCLIRNYQCVFAGVYSTYYWQNTSWDIVIHDALNGKQPFAKPRFDYYRHLQHLFTQYDFNTLLPYKPKLTINSRIGNDNFSTSGYPLTDGKGLYLYFIPAENYQINVVVPKQAAGKFEATWFNIFTGETRQEEPADYQMFKSYQSPWKEKAAVLILKSK